MGADSSIWGEMPTEPLAVGKRYDFHEFGWHPGNVGSNGKCRLRAGPLRGGRSKASGEIWDF